MPKKGAFKKKEKYAHEFATTKSVMVMKYKDNNVVSLASNFDNDSIGSKKRYSVESKCHIAVAQPSVVHNYNQHMGGVDQLDQWVASYRTRMRQKKWWWPIFIYFFDVAVVNSWLLWKKQSKNSNESLLNFRRNLAITLLKQYGTASKQGKQPAKPIESVRFDSLDHWLRTGKMRRCGNCVGKATFFCTKCDIGLHPRCHEEYHKK